MKEKGKTDMRFHWSLSPLLELKICKCLSSKIVEGVLQKAVHLMNWSYCGYKRPQVNIWSVAKRLRLQLNCEEILRSHVKYVCWSVIDDRLESSNDSNDELCLFVFSDFLSFIPEVFSERWCFPGIKSLVMNFRAHWSSADKAQSQQH